MTVSNTAVIAELRTVLADSGLLTNHSDLAPCETGARYDRGQTAFVAWPRCLASCGKSETSYLLQLQAIPQP